MTKNFSLVLSLLFLVACNTGDSSVESVPEETAKPDTVAVETSTPAVTFKPGRESRSPGKPQGPVTIAYKIVGSPVVGRPLAIELRVNSALGAQPVELSYRINDATALQLAESQPAFANISPTADRPERTQQVMVVPLRQGRVFLNVAATVQGQDGSLSTITAVPIEVGNGPRKIEQQGEVVTDEDGEAVRVLSGEN